jgi:superfamily II DNA/RNA helicase
MANVLKNQAEILAKLNIEQLNTMQLDTQKAFQKSPNLVLLSPTGTGKTLAFLLPIISQLEEKCTEIQAVIVVPTRELAIQIEQVVRSLGSGFKSNAVYGGQSFSTDLIHLKHPPAILIGTPGRLSDHLRRNTFKIEDITTLVLDEFDKSLEIGFELEMKAIIAALPKIKQKILTSATAGVEIPAFIKLKQPLVLNYLKEKVDLLTIQLVVSPTKDKLETLVELLNHLNGQSGIIFCNFKETIQRVSDFLNEHDFNHGIFFGGMEQRDRERALIQFRNGSFKILLATDLAARGIDVPEMQYIIHYQLPLRKEEFTHRNGRTARMHQEGTAYVIHFEKEPLPDFISESNPQKFELKAPVKATVAKTAEWTTLFISGGRKDKISKGDIAGLCFKIGGLQKEELGVIELKDDCAFVAVAAHKANALIAKINNTKLKQKKVRISIV